ncbi:hypothetical protein LZ30DRAFT_694947 [Colletotrichum cereale]|nr:hypothetical protein LZ30DRAFT_694947 [Colletotrichum cereale]
MALIALGIVAPFRGLGKASGLMQWRAAPPANAGEEDERDGRPEAEGDTLLPRGRGPFDLSRLRPLRVKRGMGSAMPCAVCWGSWGQFRTVRAGAILILIAGPGKRKVGTTLFRSFGFG